MTDIPKEVQSMIENAGVYLCGDTTDPDATVPIISSAGKLYSMVIDTEINPTRFYPTVTIAGPFSKDDEK